MGLNKLNDELDASVSYAGREFIGRVVEVNDPEGLGRFKCTIPGIYELPDLPWIGAIRYSPFGTGKDPQSGKTFGVYGTPAMGAAVTIKFQDGDVNYPIATGCVLTFGDKDSVFAAHTVWGFRDPSGNLLVVDMAANTMKFTHSTQTSFTIGADGKVTVKAPETIIDGDFKVLGNTNLSQQVTHVGDFLRSNGVTLHTHTHPGDSGGTTGPPNAG